MPANAGTQGNWIDLCPLGPRFCGGDKNGNAQSTAFGQ
jgi:hypothetical protein